MCLNRSHAKPLPVTSARQQGFLVPMALFILVGAATLAVAMAQMSSGSRSSAVMAALSAQAFYAADAGVQSAMGQMYFSAVSRAAVDANCSAVDGSSLALSGAGIAGCNVDVRCDVRVSDDGVVSIYTVESVSQCGSGDYLTGRRVMVEAYMHND